MKGIIARILSRPVGVLVASIAVVVMGVLSFVNIPLQLLPEGFESRHLTVRASLRDSSAAEAERHVAIPIEESLGTVGGIESIRSRCSGGQVRISVELKADADPATVERDVRDRVARVEPDLPDDVDRVRVYRHGASDRPILFFSCRAELARLDLSDFVEDVLLPRLEAVDGVARADAWGLLQRTVRIWLDQEEVARRNLDLREVLRRLRGDNLAADLGDVKEGDRTAYVRATMEFDSLDEIREFPVLAGVRIRDIARVEVVPSLDQSWSRYNGIPTVAGTVYKMAGANTVEACRRVRELFDELQASHPEIPSLKIRPFFDQGEIIESSLATLYKNALYGGCLAVLVLYSFFHRLRMTLLVAAAIPLSLTIAVTVLYLGGDSLNVATMMGLTLAVGMLIDNAIVIVESILRRRELGTEPRDSAATGTGEVGLAVLTGTLTTIVVFLPAIFLSSDTNARLWLYSIGGPIAYALLASLAVALILIPLGSIYLRLKKARTDVDTDHKVITGIRARYGRFLGRALTQRFVVVFLAVLVCMSVQIPLDGLGQRGTMGEGRGPVRVQLRFPRHYEMREADAAIRRYEKYVAEVKERLEIDGIYARFNRYGGMVMMWSTDDSDKPRDELRDGIHENWPQIPGIWTSLETVGNEGTTSVRLEGEEPDVLEKTMDIIEARLGGLDSVAETNREREEMNLQELRVRIDPEAVERGLIVPDTVRGMIGWVLRGARLRDYKGTGRDLPLLMELDPEQAVEVSDLGELLIPTDQGLKPLSILSKVRIHNAAASIERRDGRRTAEMQVVGKEEDDRRFYEQVYSELSKVELPPGVRFRVEGGWAAVQESFSALGDAFKLALVLVFLLTGILFEALLLPLAVLFTIPTAIVGGIWALYLSGKPMDELSIMGFILLVGIVVNNGIVLIDRVQQWRRKGLPMRAAVRAAGRDRVRPVVMTALTTIVGLLPMAVIKGSRNEIPYDSLAVAVIGGLILSTLVTLVLVPVAFTLLTDLGRIGSRGLRRALAVLR